MDLKRHNEYYINESQTLQGIREVSFGESKEFADRWLAYRERGVVLKQQLLFPKLLTSLNLHGGLRLVDAGCAEGEFLSVLKASGHLELIGLELNPFLVSLAQSRLGIVVHQADLSRRWPLETKSVDRVVCSNVLMVFNQPELDCFYAEASRVLAPDGLLVTVVVHPAWAKEMYSLCEDTTGTLTRDAADGELRTKEFYRSSKAYADRAAVSGFSLISVEEVRVEATPGLPDRYQEKLGQPIFELHYFRR